MTRTAVVRLVTKLYAAAGGREASDVDFETYAEALETVDDDLGSQAGRELIRTVDLVARRPSPALVVDAAADVARRRASSAGLNSGQAPRRCELCDDSGWRDVATVSGAPAVARCRCSKGQPPTEHPNGCSCSACYYGPDNAAGRHAGHYRGDGPHPLQAMPEHDRRAL